MRWRQLLVGATLPVACESFDLAPIELDVSSNCNAVEVVTTARGVQSPARPWGTVFAAASDRAGSASSWLLAVRPVGGGLDQLALIHVDEDLRIEHEIVIDAPPGLADQFELVTGPAAGSIFVTQRAPGTFYVRQYDAAQTLPLIASSPNLATVPAPCDPDGDGVYQSCDASAWFQDLVFFDQLPYALTFPPSSNDFSIEVTPTPLDAYLSPSFPLNNDRTLDFGPVCNQDLPVEDLELCEAHIGELSYPRLASAGLRRDVRQGYVVLALFREIQTGDDPATVADSPLLLFGLNDLATPTGILRVDPVLPEPRDTSPRGVALDPNASYFHYTATTGEQVLARASHSSLTIERLDQAFEFPAGAELMQLDDDLALHRIVDSQWEILKLFPDAPARSELTRVADGAPIENVLAAGPSTFMIRRTDGTADLVHVRCAVPGVAP